MRIICPACGSNQAVPANVRGSAYQCRSCGKRISVPEVDVEQPIEPEPDDELASAAAAAILRPTTQSRKPKSDLTKYLLAGGIGAVATAIVAVLVMVMQKAPAPQTNSQSPPPSALATTIPAAEPVAAWDRAHRGELLEMKTHADDLAIAEQWRDAYEAYRQILTTVADHDVTDPVVLQVVAGARVGQDRVLTALMPGQPSTVAVPQAPAIAASATTQAATMPIAKASPSTLPAIASSQPAQPTVNPDPAELAADAAPVLPGPPPPPPDLKAYTLADGVTDQQIGEAIGKAIAFLSGQFRNGEITTSPINRNARVGTAGPGRPPTNLDHASDLGEAAPTQQQILPGPQTAAPWESAYSVPGIDALCVYALLHAGQAMDKKTLDAEDPFVDLILTTLKSYDLVYTYHRSLRAAALAVFNRTQDSASLEDDVRWLLAAGGGGAYTYTIPPNPDNAPWDNSNSQYGLLGVWSGAIAGKAVPSDYWRSVEKHWNLSANADGTFGYIQGTSSTTMTCAGVASLLVAHEYLDGPDTIGNAGGNVSPSVAIDNGLKWLDSGDNCMSAWGNMGGTGYALYGLERVGLASGFKYFGTHDWYTELAKRLVNEQHFDGSWGTTPAVNGVVAPQTLVNTAYALLFLARGRHPILFNKLRYEGNWNNRPHDVAHLARFAAHELEHPLNWQVVNLRRNWFDWMDSPVLYISGSTTPNFQPADYDALRGFSNAGGLIFTHADNGSPEFTRWVITELTKKLYPKYELLQVPRDHAIYSTVYQLKSPPPLLSISNASRLLLIHSPTDLAGGWQLNWTDEKKTAFQLGVNIFVYAAGKGNLKNRLASSYIPNDPDLADSTRQIARLQYAGEWDPEPYAWGRFRRYFQWKTHQAIEPITVQLKDLKPAQVPMAVLTGTVRNDFTAEEQNAARAFVANGGVLLIDACGGQVDFARSVERTLLPQAFEGVSPLPLGPNHPLLIASRPHADDLTTLILRPYANENGGKDLPLESISYGKGWVIFSRLDITTGLLGTRSWGILGYDPAYAQALVKNAVLWAEARSPAAAN
jgi:hypothetical protein